MKKHKLLSLLASLAAAATIFAALSAVPASAEVRNGTGWSFDTETGVLTCSSNDGVNNWSSNVGRANVLSVVCTDDVTAIGAGVFEYCVNLTTAEMPEVITIGEYAFRACTSLTALSLPEATTLGEYAFDRCTSLTALSLPEATRLGGHAFSGCTSLTMAFLPKLQSLLSVAFLSCPNAKVYFNIYSDVRNTNTTNFLRFTDQGDGWAFCETDGMLYIYTNDGTTDWVANISDKTKVRKLFCDYAVTEIGTSAFTNCINLETAIMPKVTSIGDYAFRSASLTEANMPEAITIGDQAFCYCTVLAEASMPKAQTIGSFAFDRCEKLTAATMPKAQTIAASAFEGCTKLASVDLPEATTIGSNAFKNCDGLTAATMPKVQTISSSAFEGCTKLASVDLPEATTIGSNAFKSCDGLTAATMPKVQTISSSAFEGCTKLASVDLPEATTIDNNAFKSCDGLTAVTMPKARTISSSAFEGCTKLASVDLPEATTIGSNAFNTCNKLVTATMPKVQEIGEAAFYACSQLTAAVLPEATLIGMHAFMDCSALNTVTIPKITTIGSGAFNGCDSLTSITIPASLTSIGNYAFKNCNTLSDISFLGNIPTERDANFCENCALSITCTVPYGADLTAWAAAFGNPENVTFVNAPLITHTITVSAGAGGSISPSSAITVNDGESKTFTITPASNYSIASVTVDGVNQGAISFYTFTNVIEDHTISAAFIYNGGGVSISKTYNITNGANGEWKGISDKGLEFAADGNAEDLLRVEVDGKTVAPENYDVKSDSALVITLKPEYLKTLSAGSHLIALVYEEGSCSAHFTTTAGVTEADAGDNAGAETTEALPKPQENENPPTGNSLSGISAVALLSLAAAGAAIKKRRK